MITTSGFKFRLWVPIVQSLLPLWDHVPRLFSFYKMDASEVRVWGFVYFKRAHQEDSYDGGKFDVVVIKFIPFRIHKLNPYKHLYNDQERT
jgi:hypothetical protein